jgi:hypothetical protein
MRLGNLARSRHSFLPLLSSSLPLSLFPFISTSLPPHILLFCCCPALQGQPEHVAFALRQDAGSRWDLAVLSYFVNLLSLPSPAIMDVFDDASGAREPCCLQCVSVPGFSS